MIKNIKLAYAGLIYLFLYLPIIVLVAYSFNDSKYSLNWSGFTLKWYISLWEEGLLIESAINSLLLALASSTLVVILGSLSAVSFARYQFKGKKAFQWILFVMTMTPDIVMAISLLTVFTVFHIQLGFFSLLLSHVTFSLPFVIGTIYSRLTDFNQSMIEAAIDLGASDWLVFRKILLPLIFPAICSGWLLAFTLSLDDVVISFFVTGPSFEILPIKIYSLVRLGFKPEVSAIAACLLLFSMTMAFMAQRFFLKKY